MLFPPVIRRGSEVHSVGVRWVVYSQGGAGQRGSHHVFWLIGASAIVQPLSQILLGPTLANGPGTMLEQTTQRAQPEKRVQERRPVVDRMKRSHIVIHVLLKARNFKFAAPSRFDIYSSFEIAEEQN